jgi:hypothetical protein
MRRKSRVGKGCLRHPEVLPPGDEPNQANKILKSTLSQLTRQFLRNRYRAKRDAVASIFITSDVTARDKTFATRVLASILRQLDPAAQPRPEPPPQHADDDKTVREHLRAAICSALDTLDRAFLLVDDFNRCDLDLQAALELEMRHFQDRGLKIMVSSRVPRLDNSYIATECDCPDCDAEGGEVHVFWKCEMCEVIVCYSCRDKGKYCPNW